MAGFKGNRKSQSQMRTAASRARTKLLRVKKMRDKHTHSTALAFIGMGFASLEAYQIGHFKFNPVDPILANLGGTDKAFTNKEDYGTYAPFRLQIIAELTTCEKDWTNVTIDGVRFGDLEPEDRDNEIQKFSSAIILLLRLKGLTNFITPLSIKGSTFQELREKSGTVELRARFQQSLIEFLPSPNLNPILQKENDFRWIEQHLSTINQLNRDGRMNFIHDIFD